MAAAAAAEANLGRYQCLYTWEKRIMEECDPLRVIACVKDKLLTTDCDWRSIIYNLVLFFEYASIRDHENARGHLAECENLIQAAECFEAGDLIIRTKDALKHVIHASWAHFVASQYALNEYKDYLAEIMQYKNMNRSLKAAVWGIRAACLMQYGTKGYQTAEETIKNAIRFDPEEPEWRYLLGEILRFHRFHSKDVDLPPSALEIETLEKAYSYDQHSPAYCIALASSLYDSVRKDKGRSPTRDRATQLYKKALEKWPNSAFVNLRCASGLLEYAYPVRDTQLADKCLDKAVKLAPNSCHVHLVLGVFFWWPCKNRTVASGHLNKAKMRYTALVQDIKEEKISNYRIALCHGIWEASFQEVLEEPVYLL